MPIFRNIIDSFKARQSGLKSDDFLIVSFPKSGSTYTRFVFANIISAIYLHSKEVNFYNLGEIMPEYGKDNLNSEWAYPGFPRMIKTHSNYRRVFDSTKNILYIVRDPKDVMISYFHYLNNRKEGNKYQTILDLIKCESNGLSAIVRHVDSWIEHSNIVFRYEDLMVDSLEPIQSFFSRNKIEIDSNIIRESIQKASPQNVKSIERKQGRPNSGQNFEKNFVFVRNAGSGQWKSVFTEEMLQYYDTRKSQNLINLGY